MNKPALTFIKIGGSLITHKSQAFSLNQKALELIVREIKTAQDHPGKIILGHGSGSFGHVAAEKYQTQKGVINKDSYQGIVEVAQAAAELHQLVMKELLSVGVKALSFPPHAFMMSQNNQLDSLYVDSLEKALTLDLLPVVYGDQMLDRVTGCTIFSTEEVLSSLALTLQDQGYEIKQMIQCGQTNGVYDQDGQTIPLITPDNFAQYQTSIAGSEEVDVTGGMLHKVKQSLELAEQGIESLIIDGIEHGSLSQAIAGKVVVGTKIKAN